MNYLQKKKLDFMSIVNSVKGFVRNITGVFPLTLTNCVDSRSIIDYTIYGNSVQNGTPTPDTPIEVESVGEYDEIIGKYKIPIKVSGKNLFEHKYFFNNKKQGLGQVASTNDGLIYQLKPNTDYTASCNVPYVASEGVQLGYFFIQSGNIYTPPGTGANGFGIRTDGVVVTKTVTTDKNGYLYITTRNSGSTIGAVDKTLFDNGTYWLQLEEGTATDYEPYHEPITTNIYLDEPLGEGQSINYKKDGLPPIPTFKGTSIISADTTIQPSNAEIEYYSNVKE